MEQNFLKLIESLRLAHYIFLPFLKLFKNSLLKYSYNLFTKKKITGSHVIYFYKNVLLNNRFIGIKTLFGCSSWKQSVATVFLSTTKYHSLIINGQVYVFNNEKNDFLNYFKILLFKIKQLLGNFGLEIIVNGGGITSQMKAISLALTKILENFFFKKKNNSKILYLFNHQAKKKERKKFGFKKARKSFQYSKR